MSEVDVDLDEIQKQIERGEFDDATATIFMKLFYVITKQEVALRRIVAALDEESDLCRRIYNDSVTAHVHGASDYQGTTLRDMREWAEMGLGH